MLGKIQLSHSIRLLLLILVGQGGVSEVLASKETMRFWWKSSKQKEAEKPHQKVYAELSKTLPLKEKMHPLDEKGFLTFLMNPASFATESDPQLLKALKSIKNKKENQETWMWMIAALAMNPRMNPGILGLHTAYLFSDEVKAFLLHELVSLKNSPLYKCLAWAYLYEKGASFLELEDFNKVKTSIALLVDESPIKMLTDYFIWRYEGKDNHEKQASDPLCQLLQSIPELKDANRFVPGQKKILPIKGTQIQIGAASVNFQFSSASAVQSSSPPDPYEAIYHSLLTLLQDDNIRNAQPSCSYETLLLNLLINANLFQGKFDVGLLNQVRWIKNNFQDEWPLVLAGMALNPRMNNLIEHECSVPFSPDIKQFIFYELAHSRISFHQVLAWAHLYEMGGDFLALKDMSGIEKNMMSTVPASLTDIATYVFTKFALFSDEEQIKRLKNSHFSPSMFLMLKKDLNLYLLMCGEKHLECVYAKHSLFEVGKELMAHSRSSSLEVQTKKNMHMLANDFLLKAYQCGHPHSAKFDFLWKDMYDYAVTYIREWDFEVSRKLLHHQFLTHPNTFHVEMDRATEICQMLYFLKPYISNVSIECLQNSTNELKQPISIQQWCKEKKENTRIFVSNAQVFGEIYGNNNLFIAFKECIHHYNLISPLRKYVINFLDQLMIHFIGQFSFEKNYENATKWIFFKHYLRADALRPWEDEILKMMEEMGLKAGKRNVKKAWKALNNIEFDPHLFDQAIQSIAQEEESDKDLLFSIFDDHDGNVQQKTGAPLLNLEGDEDENTILSIFRDHDGTVQQQTGVPPVLLRGSPQDQAAKADDLFCSE